MLIYSQNILPEASKTILDQTSCHHDPDKLTYKIKHYIRTTTLILDRITQSFHLKNSGKLFIFSVF